MPAVRNKRPTQKTGRNSSRGNDRQVHRRKTNGVEKEAGPRSFAHSLSSLRVNSYPGGKVLASHSKIGGFDLMIASLVKCVKRIDPKYVHDKKVADYVQLANLLSAAAAGIPEDVKYMLSGDKNGFWITLYKICEYVNYLPGISLKRPLQILKQKDQKLHDLFVSFIGKFIYETCIDSYWSGVYPGVCDMVRENLDVDDRYDDDPEIKELISEHLAEHDTGDADLYRQLFKKAKELSLKTITTRIRKYNGKSPLKKLMLRGVELLKPGYKMHDFSNEEISLAETETDTWLSFDSQAIALWFDRSPLNDEYDNWIDSDANELGLEPPSALIKVTPYGQKMDLKGLYDRAKWPLQLSNFITSLQAALIKLK